nr:Molecular chaperone Hsp31 and glyoxalase 3 [Raoultella sp. NCTC 9187]
MTGSPSDDRHPAPDAAEDKVHKDRRLLTGDSPLASNNPGKLAAKTLLADVAAR